MEPHKWNWLKNKLVWLICSVLVIAGGGSAALAHYIENAYLEITLNDNGYIVQIETMEKTVEELLDKYEIKLGPGDEVTPGPEEALEDGTEVKIDRAFRVTVAVDGKVKTVHLTQGTIKDALDRAYVVLKEKDFTNYDLGDEVSPGDHIRVTRVKEEFITEEENLPYKVVTRENNKLKKGTEKVVREGKEGKKERKILIAYHDGVEVDRKVVEEKVAAEPVDRVIDRGTYVQPAPVSRGSVTREKSQKANNESSKSLNNKGSSNKGSTKKSDNDRAKAKETSKKENASEEKKESTKASGTKTFRATAYTHTGSKTRTGVWPKVGMIAVDPKVIPLYTKVYVEFPSGWTHLNGYYQAMDTGGAIKGDIIDVFFDDESIVRKFGRRKVKITFNK